MSKREILWLSIVYLIISLVIFTLTSISKRRFSEGWLDRMVSAKGRAKQLTEDPCAFAIAGEPNAAGRYIKLIVTCAGGRQSWNTFDVRAIQADTLEQLLLEFHRINGISAETKRYKCDSDSAPIELTSKLQIPSTVNCRYE
jgi:hypothetical protein